MIITVYSDFSKRKNSTLQPGGGTRIDVKLKNDTSVERPSFILSAGMSDITYVEAFGHYYFVDDCISLANGLCEIVCSMDVLATYKGEIGNTDAFIMYDESANPGIVDLRIATKYRPVVSSMQGTFHTGITYAGMFVATITGTDGTRAYKIPAGRIYKLIPDLEAEIKNIFAQDYTPQGILDLDFVPTIISAIRQIIGTGTLAENIRDVRFIPFQMADANSHRVMIGIYDSGYDAYTIPIDGYARFTKSSHSLSIPWHYNDWRRANTEIYLRIPFVGLVSYSASVLAPYSSITIESSLDCITGEMAIEVWTSDHKILLGGYGASVGMEMPIGSTSFHLGTAVTALSNVTSAISGGPVGQFSYIANAVKAFTTPLTQTVGGLGSSATLGLLNDGGNLNVYIACVTYETNIDPSSVSSVMGTPTFAVKTIGSLSGFIQCQNASVAVNAHASERDQINSYLNSGFYYE